ncbi:MAG: hypothetical protein WAV41_04125 [Microgenomates group bacterium]
MATMLENGERAILILESVDPCVVAIDGQWLSVDKHSSQIGHRVGLRMTNHPRIYGVNNHISMYCDESNPCHIYERGKHSLQRTGWVAFHSDVDDLKK